MKDTKLMRTIGIWSGIAIIVCAFPVVKSGVVSGVVFGVAVGKSPARLDALEPAFLDVSNRVVRIETAGSVATNQNAEILSVLQDIKKAIHKP
jgi:uncharacterized protein YgbK (DUF1537 family)